jgi:tetratricopeptide (TPR) repeat protein
VADLLGRLVDKNLVVYLRHTPRWRLLDTVRAYGRQQLAAADEQASVQRRHLRWAQTAAAALEDRLDDEWQDEFDIVVDDLRAALRDLPPGPEPTAHQLARSLGHLLYARRLRQEAVDRYREAARYAPTPADAAADLRSAAACAAAIFRTGLAIELTIAAADKAGEAGEDESRTAALADAVSLATRYRSSQAVEVSAQRLRELHEEAAAAASPGNPFITAAIGITASWTADRSREDLVLAERALSAARVTEDQVLIWAAIDTVASVYETRGQMRLAYQLTQGGLPLLDTLDRNDPRNSRTVHSAYHLTSLYAMTVGDFPAAIAVGRAAATDPVAGEPLGLARMLVPPLVLIGEFDEALRHADAMWQAWLSAGRPVAGWLWFSAATAALALGLTGDRDGYQLWRGRMSDLAGPQNAYRLDGASSAAFADARMAVHTGDLTDAPAIIERPFADPAPGPRYRVFAQPAAAELAVVAGLPDALRYLDAAEDLAAENGWARACLARARGRYHRDVEALRESIAEWERIGAHFEAACTRRLLREHTGSGTPSPER